MLYDFIVNYFPSFVSAVLLYGITALCYGSYLYNREETNIPVSGIILIIIASIIWPISIFVGWFGQWLLDGIDIR